MRDRQNAAVFRIAHCDDAKSSNGYGSVSATIQIAEPLLATPSNRSVLDTHLPPEQLGRVILGGVRVGTALPLFDVTYRGAVEMLPLELSQSLWLDDKPMFMRDVATVIERVCEHEFISIADWNTLNSQLLRPRQLAHVYTCLFDWRFQRELVNEKLFEVTIESWCERTRSNVLVADACSASN